jgi:hypothetical protein
VFEYQSRMDQLYRRQIDQSFSQVQAMELERKLARIPSPDFLQIQRVYIEPHDALRSAAINAFESVPASDSKHRD